MSCPTRGKREAWPVASTGCWRRYEWNMCRPVMATSARAATLLNGDITKSAEASLYAHAGGIIEMTTP